MERKPILKKSLLKSFMFEHFNSGTADIVLIPIYVAGHLTFHLGRKLPPLPHRTNVQGIDNINR